jgi:phospholipid/cholesterol/gamma-HCH transport system substrate-binding protein
MATPQMRKDVRSVMAGTVVLTVIALLLYIAVEAQSGWPLAKTTTVSAEIKDVHTLSVNDQVRQSSKRIGRVSAIEYHDGNALVTMELEGKRKVYGNARAQVWDASALAMKFIEFSPGSPKAGNLGSRPISLKRTTGSADLQQLLAVLDPKTRAQATSTLREVGGGVAGHSEDLHDFLGTAPDLLNDLETTGKALNSSEMDLPKLLETTDELAGRFEGREAKISALVSEADATLQAISVDDGKPLEASLQQSPETLSKARSALADLDKPLADLEVAMRKGAPGARALGKATPDLRSFLRDSVPVLGKVPNVSDRAVPAVNSLTKTLADARPLAPRLSTALADLATPLGVLAPYGPEIAQLFVRGHSFVSEGPAPGKRWARLSANAGLFSVTGGLFGSDGYTRNEYPKPGEATGDRSTAGLPAGLIPGSSE